MADVHPFGCQCGEHEPPEIIEAEIIDVDEDSTTTGHQLVPFEPVIDAELVEDNVGKTVAVDHGADGTSMAFATTNPDGTTSVEVDVAPPRLSGVAVPTGPDVCWWRLGPNIRDRNKLAHAYGVVDILDHTVADEDGRNRGILTLVWRDGHKTDAPVAHYYAEFENTEPVPVKEGWTENITYHSRLRLAYVDILVARPPALPEATDWQQMTRRGNLVYPGTDMRMWTFNDPWEDTPAGFYPHTTSPQQQPRPIENNPKEIRW